MTPARLESEARYAAQRIEAERTAAVIATFVDPSERRIVSAYAAGLPSSASSSVCRRCAGAVDSTR